MSSSPESQRSMPEWQSGDPYETALTREAYACEKRLLQIELLKLQAHITRSSDRVLILFEGRDAAGKGGAITRFMEHLNPGVPVSWHSTNPPMRSGRSGISSATSRISPPAERS